MSKLKMIFKRILHPVGQGAFFTEQFIDVNGNVDFCIAYDCGTNSKRNLFKTEVEKLKSDDSSNVLHLNMLFISHFDNDHVNCIPYLIKIGAIDKNTVVVIPFKHPLLLEVFMSCAHVTKGCRNAIESLYANRIKMIGIDPNGESPINENLFLEASNIEDFYGKYSKFGYLPSKVNLSYNVLWNYIPFAVSQDKTIYKQFEDQVKNEGLDINQLNNFDYLQDKNNRTALIKIYMKVGNPKTGITLINATSLQLLSFVNTHASRKFEISSTFLPHCCFRCYECRSRFREYYCDHYCGVKYSCCNFSCLYTGDTKIDADFLNLLQGIQNNIKRICMFQIPHHGRLSCYNKNIFNQNVCNYFVNLNMAYKANRFIYRIANDALSENKSFLKITENPKSELIFCVRFIES